MSLSMDSSSSELLPCGHTAVSTHPSGLCPVCLLQLAVSPAKPSGLDLPADPPATPESLQQQIRGYRFLSRVGQGGMGTVYEAVHERLQMRVAIKILSATRANDPAWAERFLQEAQILAKLNHPQIVRVLDAGQAEDLLYLVMEFVDGITLRDLIRQGPVSPTETLRLVQQIVAALQFMHDQQVIHRDIKPENLLLDENGSVRIADFGIARRMTDDPRQQMFLTADGQQPGTPSYMACELLRSTPGAADPRSADARSDLYSLGVVIYELLTGQLPQADYQPPSRLCTECRSEPMWDRIVSRLLKSDPDARYQTADELAHDLQRLSRPERAPRTKSRSLALLPLAVLIVSLVVAGWQQFFPPADPGLAVPSSTGVRTEASVLSATTLPPALARSRPDLPPNERSESTQTARSKVSPAVPKKSEPGAAADLVGPEMVGTKAVGTKAVGTKAVGTKAVGVANETDLEPTPLMQTPLLSAEYEWGLPENLGAGVNSSADDSHPTATADGLTLLFVRGFQTLYQCRRSAVDQPFGSAEKILGPVNEGGNVDAPFITEDGLTLYFASSRAGTLGMNDLWVSQRPRRDEPFSDPIHLGSAINTRREESTPSINSNGTLLIFCARRPEGGGVDLFYAHRKDASHEFAEPHHFPPPVNTEFNDFFARWVSRGRGLIVTTTWSNQGDQKFRLLARQNAQESLQPTTVFDKFPSQGTVSACAVFDGERTLIFDSNGPGGHGKFDLWQIRRVKKQ